MNYSADNTTLWNFVIQFGLISGTLIFSHFLRRKVPLVEKSLMPTSALAGFLLLVIRNLNIIRIDPVMLELITYHGIAIGFIAMSLQTADEYENISPVGLSGPKSGALIVSTYLVQALAGLAISLGLFYTIMPGMFPAAGIVLPMGYGQGAGQANNVGGAYEAMGFTGGRTFALSIAAIGYLCACVVGILYLHFLVRKKGIQTVSGKKSPVSGSVTITYAGDDEMPAEESLDRLSSQVALVLMIYLFTYWLTYGITWALERLSPALSDAVSFILWGFNFIIGSVLAMGAKVLLKKLRQKKLINHQYQNNYLLSRISGLAFDLMIVAGIASINIDNLSGLWLPFILMSIAGGVVTLFYVQWMCKKLYPGAVYENFLAMYGMLTGTISSGILLLRELDPEFKTSAAGNLLYGSSFAIVFGAPMLVLIGMAPKNVSMTWLVFGLIAVYLAVLLVYMLKSKKTASSKKSGSVKTAK